MLKHITNRPWLACTLVAVFTLAGRLAILPWYHVPQPAVHDEFSYLLAADTYASGRVTNPPHAMWRHFETFHVLQQPTYSSKYPPLPGLFMAFGQRVFRTPWVGVWLSVGLMCGAVCWMLQGWISPGWALLGGVMVAMRIGILSYWMNSYWGGALAAVGGALVLGAVPRIVKRRRIRDAVVFALGLVVLMNSRPYEGFVLGALASVAVVWWMRGEGRLEIVPWVINLPHMVCVVGGVLAVAFGVMAYQNWRVTGDPLLLPYVAHDRQYAAASLFLWSDAHAALTYRHAELRRYWAEWQVQAGQKARQDIVAQFCVRLGALYEFFFGLWPVLAVVLIWPYRLKTPEERWTALILGIALVATVAPLTGVLPHYAAPLTALLYLRLLQGLSRIPGRAIVAILLVAFAAQFVYVLSRGDQIPQLAWDRAQIVSQIERVPGDHLVLVHYSTNHDVHQEWVANRADIDRARIVWAREMGPAADAPLLGYFQTRHAWVLDADASPPRIDPYPGVDFSIAGR